MKVYVSRLGRLAPNHEYVIGGWAYIACNWNQVCTMPNVCSI
jgi:hypothetical protein